ncbi:hypothetical protein QUA35_02885 [Microcoleus sp. N9_B2]|uniref:hypothetical protein n=1 Tax=unclassified Microcoleus TaxID=2642155 RepID=UPI002FD10FBD
MTNSEPTTPQRYFISIVDFYVYLYNLAATDRRGRVPARVRSPVSEIIIFPGSRCSSRKRAGRSHPRHPSDLTGFNITESETDNECDNYRSQ